MTNDTTFAIGAFGNSINVLTPTNLMYHPDYYYYYHTAFYDSLGGAYWYNQENSFGFADKSTINLLVSCDEGAQSPDCLSRLCWNINDPTGGYRAGCTVNLNFDPNWRKVMYTANTIYQCKPGKCLVS